MTEAQPQLVPCHSKACWVCSTFCASVMLLTGCGDTLLSSHPHPPGSNGASESAYQTYMLPKALLRLQLRREDDAFKVNVSEPIIVGDAKHRYDLLHNESFFASDTFDVEVDEKTGLITSINTSTDLQVDEILVAGAGAAGALVTIFESAAPEGNEQILVDELVDPTVRSEVDSVVARMNRVYGQIKGRSCASAGDQACIQVRVNGEGFDYLEPAATTTTDPACNVGICYRAVLPFRVFASVINESKDAKGQFPNSSSTIVVLPDPASVLHLDTSRPAFVARTTNLTMVNGMVQKVHVEKPSEAVTMLGTPVRIIEAFFSAAGAVFRARKDPVEAQTELVKARTEQQKAQDARRESATRALPPGIPLLLQVTDGVAAPATSQGDQGPILPTRGQGAGAPGPGMGGQDGGSQGTGGGAAAVPGGGSVLERR